MKYSDGNDVQLGDVVLDNDLKKNGVIVFSVDSDEYSEFYPKEEWAHLGSGAMVNFGQGEDVFYEGLEPHGSLKLIKRKSV